MKIGYFSQSYERLDSQQTILDNFLTEYGMTDEQTRRLLGSMLFRGKTSIKPSGAFPAVRKLVWSSLKLVLDGANCLVLDEPTNHLDIMAKEAVEAALETFDGTVLLVTHDRYLVNEVAGRIWAVEKGTSRIITAITTSIWKNGTNANSGKRRFRNPLIERRREEPVKPDGSKHRPHEEKSKTSGSIRRLRRKNSCLK